MSLRNNVCSSLKAVSVAIVAGILVGNCDVARSNASTDAAPKDLFNYEHSSNVDVNQRRTEERNGVVIKDIDYPSLQNRHGPIKALIVRPQGNGPFAGIVFFHWLGETKSDRTEFLDEAVQFAREGAVSLLIQGFFPWSEKPLDGETDRQRIIDQTIELRRAVDLLLAEPGVDPKRIGFVGHDYGAMFGAIQSGLDARVRAYVMIAGLGTFSDWSLKYWPKTAAKGEQAYRQAVSALDPVHFVASAAPANLLFQFADNDKYISRPNAEAFFNAASEPKSIKWYAADHQLAVDAAARDRRAWLQQQLRLRPAGAAGGVSGNPNGNHALLAELAGSWDYTLKLWMGPNRPAVETAGRVGRKPIMGGRFLEAAFSVAELSGRSGNLEKVGRAR